MVYNINANHLQLKRRKTCLKRKAVKILSFAAAALLLAAVVLLAAGCSGRPASGPPEGGGITMVASFYPIYLHTINITRDIPGIEVVSMTEPQTGCLHDYQLTADNLKMLERADFFIINGAGMESFMDKVVAQLPHLKVVEACKGLELLTGAEQTGENGHIENEHNEEEYNEDGSHDGHGSVNPHVWVSVSGAISQVQSIAEQLAGYDGKNADKYRSNAEKYTAKLEALKEKMHGALADVENRSIVTFHEAFSYFAKEFGLSIAAVIAREPGTEPGAGELADTIRIIREAGVKVLFAEPQYSSRAAETIARETGAKIYQLDPVVTGNDDVKDFDAYIKAMERNLNVLIEALK